MPEPLFYGNYCIGVNNDLTQMNLYQYLRMSTHVKYIHRFGDYRVKSLATNKLFDHIIQCCRFMYCRYSFVLAQQASIIAILL